MPQSRNLRPELSQPAKDRVLPTPAPSKLSGPAFEALLHEIVQQCRFTTRATGAAIAMTLGEAMVCRATTGGHAPDLGVRLDTKSGLSGACVASRKVQICEDTELDSRVDVAACRTLGVRSILVVPLLADKDLLGVIELFSPMVHAFGERDVQTLEAYSRRIQDALQKEEPKPPAREPDPPPTPVPASLLPDDHGNEPLLGGGPERPRRDLVMPLLTALVIGLSIVLGALLAMHRMRARSGARMAAPPAAAASLVASNPRPVPSAGDTPASPQNPRAAQEPAGNSALQSQIPAPDPAGGLTVYQNGRPIFHVPPGRDDASQGVPSTTGTAQGPAYLSPEAAEKLLISRIEPVYPPSAITSGVQGAVGVRLTVDRNGAVSQARVFSGPPELAQAAVDAVKQWRFHPYAPGGNPETFRTVTTIDFKLR